METRFLDRFSRAGAFARATFVCILLTASSAFGAVTFDSASSAALTASGTTLSWSHTLGSGANRLVIVGVTAEDTNTADLTISAVRFNGTVMTAVPNSLASAGSGTFNRSQLFYLTNSSLPAGGAYAVTVTFAGTVNGIVAGATSLAGVAQQAPEAAATGTVASGQNISTNINALTAGAWVVAVVGSGASNVAFGTTATGMTERFDRATGVCAGAGATKEATAAGPVTMSWHASSGGRVVQSLAAFAAATSGGPTAPAITAQPQSQTVAIGGTASFSVTATGTAPLSYQWRKGGTNIAGATSLTLTLTNVQTSAAGTYSVVVSNSAGSVTSTGAVLTVTTVATPPTITAQPQSQTVAVGGTASFSVTATGTAPLSYQWRKDGANIAGATSSTLTLTNVQTSAAATYSVVVSNTAGSVTSTGALLTVNGTISGDLFVAPNGTAANPGTQASPTTLESAITRLAAGSTIWVRGGTYNYSVGITVAIGNNATASANKKIFAFNGEVPVYDFGGQAVATTSRGLTLNGNFWYVKGLTVQRAGDNGIFIGGNNNTLELCITLLNADSGVQLSRASSSFTSISQWPSNNLVLNCTSHDNRDPTDENADGFACKLTSGVGNVFRGCISHHNIDDGWDMFANTDTGAIGPVLIENCVAYANGTLSSGGTSGSGDKNGFKMGGSGVAVPHTIRRCIAFDNGHHGITDNNNPGPITVTNNTSFNNFNSNFNFRSGGHSVFTNNASLNAGSSDATFDTLTGTTNLFWVSGASNNNGGTKMISTADFQSFNAAQITRNADGSINLGTFVRLSAGSDLINGGTPGGTDIGAVESF